MTDSQDRRASRQGRKLTPSEVFDIHYAQMEVETAERELRGLVQARNDLFRKLRADGVMAAEMGRAASTEENPQGLHRTVVQRYLRRER